MGEFGSANLKLEPVFKDLLGIVYSQQSEKALLRIHQFPIFIYIILYYYMLYSERTTVCDLRHFFVFCTSF